MRTETRQKTESYDTNEAEEAGIYAEYTSISVCDTGADGKRDQTQICQILFGYSLECLKSAHDNGGIVCIVFHHVPAVHREFPDLLSDRIYSLAVV